MSIFERVPRLDIEFDTGSKNVITHSTLTKDSKSHLEIIQDRVKNDLLDSIQVFNDSKMNNLLYRINFNKEVSCAQFWKMIEETVYIFESNIENIEIEPKTYNIDHKPVYFIIIKKKDCKNRINYEGLIK